MPVMKTYIAGAPYHEGARDAIAKLRRFSGSPSATSIEIIWET